MTTKAVWKITDASGQTRMVAASRSGGRRGPGAVKKAKQRQGEMRQHLARQRVERSAEVGRGELGYVRDCRGGIAEAGRLMNEVKPSPKLAQTAVVFTNVDSVVGRAGGAVEKQHRVSYADVVNGPVVVNGRLVERDEDDGSSSFSDRVRTI